ncbi:hypothetical protein ACMYYO_01790 [Dermacoccaceae bacterium W4C1]
MSTFLIESPEGTVWWIVRQNLIALVLFVPAAFVYEVWNDGSWKAAIASAGWAAMVVGLISATVQAGSWLAVGNRLEIDTLSGSLTMVRGVGPSPLVLPAAEIMRISVWPGSNYGSLPLWRPTTSWWKCTVQLSSGRRRRITILIDEAASQKPTALLRNFAETHEIRFTSK